GAAALGSLMEASRALRAGRPGAPETLARARGEALAAAASSTGLLVNPYGWRLVIVPLQLRSALSEPRLGNPAWRPPPPATFPRFHAALAAAFAWLAHLIVARRAASAWRSMLVLAATGSLAVSGARHIGFFFAALPFVVALAGSAATSDPRRGKGR